MKTSYKLALLVILLFPPHLLFSAEHPEAHFGKYGIQFSDNIQDYQRYVGKTVQYIALKDPSYKDEYFFKKVGDYNHEYTILSISNKEKRMTFTLQQKGTKKKKNLVVNNGIDYSDDWSFYPYTFCITPSYTVPLLLTDELRADKNKYVGKKYSNGDAVFEIIDLVIQYNKDSEYPIINYVILDSRTGKTFDYRPKYIDDWEDVGKTKGAMSVLCVSRKDHEKYYTIINSNTGKTAEYRADDWDEDIKYMGKIIKNEHYKCEYEVIDFWRKYNGKVELLVKNSINGQTKTIYAENYESAAFSGDSNWKYYTSLSKVIKPSSSKVRYGKTTEVAEKDITKYSYVDNIIDILIFTTSDKFNFVLKNISSHTIKLIWNEAVFIDVDGTTSKVMHSGSKYSEKEGDQTSSVIISGAKLEDIAVPTQKVCYSSYSNNWYTNSLTSNADRKVKEQKIKLMLPIQVMDVINEYIFEFNLEWGYNHPELLGEYFFQE